MEVGEFEVFGQALNWYVGVSKCTPIHVQYTLNCRCHSCDHVLIGGGVRRGIGVKLLRQESIFSVFIWFYFEYPKIIFIQSKRIAIPML